METLGLSARASNWRKILGPICIFFIVLVWATFFIKWLGGWGPGSDYAGALFTFWIIPAIALLYIVMRWYKILSLLVFLTVGTSVAIFLAVYFPMLLVYIASTVVVLFILVHIGRRVRGFRLDPVRIQTIIRRHPVSSIVWSVVTVSVTTVLTIIIGIWIGSWWFALSGFIFPITTVLLIPPVMWIYTILNIQYWGRDIRMDEIFYAEYPGWKGPTGDHYAWQGLIFFWKRDYDLLAEWVMKPIVALKGQRQGKGGKIQQSWYKVKYSKLALVSLLLWVIVLFVTYPFFQLLTWALYPLTYWVYSKKIIRLHSRILKQDGTLVIFEPTFSVWGGVHSVAAEGKILDFNAANDKVIHSPAGSYVNYDFETSLAYGGRGHDPLDMISYLHWMDELKEAPFIYAVKKLTAHIELVGTGTPPDAVTFQQGSHRISFFQMHPEMALV